MRWFTSDLHLGDSWTTKMRYCGDDIDKHDNWLAHKWDTAISDTDEVWVLGDVARDTAPTVIGDWVMARPGRKHLVRGNHDMDLSPYEWSGLGFDTVWDGTVMILGDNLRAWLSHYPSSPRPPGINVTVHGHTHRRVKSQRDDTGLLLHVGWEAWRRPVSEKELLETI